MKLRVGDLVKVKPAPDDSFWKDRDHLYPWRGAVCTVEGILGRDFPPERRYYFLRPVDENLRFTLVHSRYLEVHHEQVA